MSKYTRARRLWRRPSPAIMAITHPVYSTTISNFLSIFCGWPQRNGCCNARQQQQMTCEMRANVAATRNEDRDIVREVHCPNIPRRAHIPSALRRMRRFKNERSERASSGSRRTRSRRFDSFRQAQTQCFVPTKRAMTGEQHDMA